MLKQFTEILLAIIFLSSCNSVITSTSTSSSTMYQDKNYSNKLGYVQILDRSYVLMGDFKNVQRINQRNKLILSFDMLEYDFSYMYAKIIHCNRDWKKSQLNDIEFLNEFNEFPINNYTFSESNITPYVNYRFALPALKKSGNYIVAIYSEDNNEPILTRRFHVFENAVDIAYDLELSSAISKRMQNHQIQLEIAYKSLNVMSPSKDVSITMLQNRNWNTAITDLTPSYFDPQLKRIQYQYFNLENNFAGANEFRFFDTRILTARGVNIAKIKRTARGIEADVVSDQTRNTNVYNEILMQDLNGGYYLNNMDLNQSQAQSNYAWVNFNLESGPVDGEVYVVGEMNSWNLNEENKLNYNSATKSYTGSLLLKQGYYNYMYFVKSPALPYWYFEGSHQQTRNLYQIMIYYREPGTVYDRLVGYREFLSGD